MSDFKKVEKKKRRNDLPSINSEDLELRNYLVKKIKMNSDESEGKNIIVPSEQELSIINITNNGKSKINKLVTQGMNTLQQVKSITLQAKDKSISKLVSIVEIIKQTLGKNNLTQKNHIFNMQDEKCKKQAFMKISLNFNPSSQGIASQNV